MDVLTSTEFRKTYASLASPTVVTVNGHTIGVWTPRRNMRTDPDWIDVPVVGGVATLPDGRTVESESQVVRVPVNHFNTRPFTPVPKRGK